MDFINYQVFNIRWAINTLNAKMEKYGLES
jgi:hypothetical protein